ncbi:isochorismate synthase [Propionicimonas paludicola]|uniref:isochorismate synthase n=1 Tax=Propionicimonas paludicola TaxID=185243 RepID=A0A2A9CTW1_9ACTN|nr:isochorismate synthase [Propionicimonas paludicola]PFG17070.1 isochorismate synthase [Propionicimonas paludicola]
MRHHEPLGKLQARTIEIPDPGELSGYLPRQDAVAWLRRGEGMIGFGEVARFQGGSFAEADAWWSRLCAELEHDSELLDLSGTGPLAFGSFPFAASHSRSEALLIVPRLILGRRRGRSWLTLIGGPGDQPELPPRQSAAAAPSGLRRDVGGLAEADWRGIVEAAVTRITDGELSKVVLARAEVHTAERPLDPRWLVGRLSEEYRDCWTFCVAGLIGASPEMLLRREGGLVTSRVLAGTIRRNGAEELDLKLARSLARSGKNLAEHELAVASVAEALAPFTSGMNVPDAPYVLELPNVLHLASDVTAVVRPGVSALRLAGELHPSAAVCGTPTADAAALIAELEQLDRGRYSGPVGWLDANGDGEFAIALRCGQIDPDRPETITVYAGCGIVAESDPAEEWAETVAKLLPMHQVLGVSSAAS